MKKERIILFMVFILFGSMTGFSQTTQKTVRENVKTIAETFVKKQAPKAAVWSLLQMEKQNMENYTTVYLVRLQPAGFIFVDPTLKDPVLSFSFESNFGDKPYERSFTEALLKDITSGKPNPILKETHVEKTWGPYVQTMWGQVNCYDQNSNLINVTNYYTPNNYAAGCVAISLSTLLHFYQWPLVGTGSYTYTDNKGSSRGTYSVNYSEEYYQWNNMLDRYRYKRSTVRQRQAAGELVFDAAVSLTMDFEPTGSTSNVNRIPASGRNNFRFDGVEKKPSSSSFWDMLDFNIAHHIPVIFAIKNKNGGGHSIVCDGLKIDENSVYYYHLNMGWWGSSNGWYRIRGTWDAGGYNAITDGIFYFLPIPQLLTPHVSEGQKKVAVTWRYPAKVDVQAFELQQKTGSGSWKRLSNTIQDTTFEVSVRSGVKQYFRVRAKVANRWPYADWSNTVKITLDVTGVPVNRESDNVMLAPNPASERLNIRFGKTVPLQMVVYNIYGRQVMHVNPAPKVSGYYLNIASLPDGLYFLRFRDKSNQLKTLKFIKH